MFILPPDSEKLENWEMYTDPECNISGFAHDHAAEIFKYLKDGIPCDKFSKLTRFYYTALILTLETWIKELEENETN